MKINNTFNPNGVLKAYTNQSKKDKLERVESKNPQTDSVEISSKAKELLELKQKVSEIPEVNLKKVAELKARVESGEYRVSSEELAKKMLAEIYKK